MTTGPCLAALLWILGLVIVLLCGALWWRAVTGLDPHDRGSL